MKRPRYITPTVETAIAIARQDGLFIADLMKLSGVCRATMAVRVHQLLADKVIYRDSTMRCYLSPHARDWIENIAKFPTLPDPPKPPKQSDKQHYVYTRAELAEIRKHMAHRVGCK